jgi:hypothetical protein
LAAVPVPAGSAGIATYSIAVGLYCNGVRSRTGVTISQAFVNQGKSSRR